ncbi:hypothetical protein F5Y16DRAFT_356911 [Xylariaceae sp. FL0255]|nr:hypothetical protein F5Y16DRAFT_356911 [Xylariaceae sp. FL0255]
MDPLSAIGAAASVAQIADIASKAATTAWHLARSVINAPVEIALLAGKLDHFALVFDQLRQQKNGVDIDFNDICPETHRALLYDLLQRNINALGSLSSLSCPPRTSPLTIKERIHWAAIDKKKARTILVELREAESSVTIAVGIVTMRIATLSHTTITSLQLSQNMLLPSLTKELADVKGHLDSQLDRVAQEIKSHTYNSVQELQDEARTTQHQCNHILQTSSETQQIQSGTTRTLGLETQSNQAMQPYSAPQLRFRQRTSEKSPVTSERPTTKDRESDLESLVTTHLLTFERNKLSNHFTWATRSFEDQPKFDTILPTIQASISSNSWHNRRNARLALRLGLKLMQQRVFYFEFNLRQVSRYWVSIPSVEFSIASVNVRPSNSPIFKACFDWNLKMVRFLLETGQASIYDVDHEMGDGLLEHVFQSMVDGRGYRLLPKEEKDFGGRLVVEYLLNSWYSPKMLHARNYGSAIYSAFSKGYFSLFNQLASRSAEMHDEIIIQRVQWSDPIIYWKQMKTLHSIGCFDWSAATGWLMWHSGTNGDWDTFLLALETAHNANRTFEIDAYLEPHIHTILSDAGVSMTAALLESALEADTGFLQLLQSPELDTPTGDTSEISSLVHNLLYGVPSINMTQAVLQALWSSLLGGIMPPESFHFPELELSLTHLLLHGLDPLCPLRFGDFWYWPSWHCSCRPQCLPIANEYAKLWNLARYQIEERQGDLSGFFCKLSEDIILPHAQYDWFLDGWVYRIVGEDQDYESESQGYEGDDQDSKGECQGYEGESQDSEGEFIAEPARSKINPDSLFYKTISPPDGRKQLSRFPVVRLLCNSLNRAGYRAEMDDDGDIWWEDDDRDRYYDAREYQPSDKSGDEALDCFICRDMEKHGLGYIIEQREYGKRRYHEYREALKKKKEDWCFY